MGSTAELIVALDFDSRDRALGLRDALSDAVDFYKVGKELFTAEGPAILKELSDSRVFLDLKYHDIPNTVMGALRVASRFGVHIADVHTMGGKSMLRAASKVARETAADSSVRLKVFGVTVLTHLSDDDLREIGVSVSSRAQVVRLAKLARESGLDGVVASPLEVEAVLQATEGGLEVLVPGVRPEWARATHDQKRVATPLEAARAGARYVVVGRAITQQANPREAALRVRDELARA